MSRYWWIFALCLLAPSAAQADVLYASDYSDLLNDIDVANANAGSTIYLAPGTYSGGALPNITQSVTLALNPSFGAPAGSAILDTTPTGEKGILTVPSGTDDVNLTVEGLTFENASISEGDGGNGAGIRDQTSGPASLLVSDSIFLDNQEGILTGDGGAPAQEQLAVSISNSTFANNGNTDGFEHAVYIFGQSLSITGSLFCGTIGGHDVKSRAATTTVTNTQLFDGAGGASYAGCGIGSTSYALDVPNGGQVSLVGDTLTQGSGTQNSAIVSYGEEGMDFVSNSFQVTEDTFDSSIAGTGIQELSNGAPSCLTPVQLAGTSFSSNLTPLSPPACVAVSEVQVTEPNAVWDLLGGLTGLSIIGVFGRRVRRRPASIAA